MNEVDVEERGWPGHFICSHNCSFRRNTLVTCGDIRIVVSTVGNYFSERSNKIVEVGPGRFYETMAFVAKFDGTYWDADAFSPLSFDSPWCHNQAAEDDVANDMHNTAVQEFVDKLKAGRLTIAAVKERSED